MALSVKQSGVLKGMAAAMLTSILVIWVSIIFDPLNYSKISQISERLSVLGLALILPTFFLIVSIGRLAKFRFFSPEDIDGSGLTTGTYEANVLQSLLQNTLEQLVIAFGVYTAWCLLMPSSWLSVVPLCSILFAVGRACFFNGYNKGAPGRAFGFALTFYSTVVSFLVLVGYQLSLGLS
ncbi:MAPEG family protein [Photobacterium sanguinicancri]|uniref:MAPEG family protein n=1 Tax=Photobacterium sanguinicancri TaxID=875932 RepID=UPI0026E36517|nr:MAPEG family protein [Photobacterium sanguinicancri]MDO6499260.1 MAPEG family protein [Photobacterium sanguinicancri]